jgi:hypothetical protein
VYSGCNLFVISEHVYCIKLRPCLLVNSACVVGLRPCLFAPHLYILYVCTYIWLHTFVDVEFMGTCCPTFHQASMIRPVSFHKASPAPRFFSHVCHVNANTRMSAPQFAVSLNSSMSSLCLSFAFDVMMTYHTHLFIHLCSQSSTAEMLGVKRNNDAHAEN